MATLTAPQDTSGLPTFRVLARRSFAAFLRREGFGLFALIGLLIFILGPMMSVIFWAFADRWRYPSLVPQVWAWQNEAEPWRFWTETFSRADILRGLPLSIGLATIVTGLSMLICLPAAYAFARFRFPGRQLFLLSFLTTNAFPRLGLYVTISVVFYQLRLMGTVPGVVLIQLVNTLLLMIWIPTAAFQGVDRALEEAGLDVGASPRRVFFQITLPLVLPALSAAVLLTFVGTFYEAQGAFIIGIPNVRTLPVIMYTLIENQVVAQYGAIVSLVLWVPSLFMLMFANRLLRGGYLTAGFGV
jgi:putative spermidine/putrescine transport system permease protein